MIELKGRLKTIAEKVDKGETMADIGTDHGFLPFYLIENGISPKVVLCDISPGSLAKAKQNAEYLSSDEGVDFRLGDGIDVLEPDEVDDIVIAGLGSTTMRKMLEKDREHSASFRKYIMQPRKDPGELRWFLSESGYAITDETLVEEGKFICEIITASTSESAVDLFEASGVDAPEGEGHLSIKWEVPPYYSVRKDDLSKEYVRRKLERERLILASLEKNSPGTDMSRNIERIQYLEEISEGMK